MNHMKTLIALVGFVLAGLGAVAQTPSNPLTPTGDTDAPGLNATTVRGCLDGQRGNYIVVEDKTGLIYRVAPDDQRVLGARLAAALEHAHLLVFRPRDAAPAAMQALLAAGWSSTAIVTLSQLVAFLSFQVRTVAGLRTLGASLGRHADAAVKAS